MIHLTAKVDNAEAKRKFKELETSARNSIKGIETQSEGLDRSATKLRGAMSMIGISTAAATAAVVGLAKKSIAAYNEQAAAVNILNAALKSTGNVVGYTSQELQDFASSLQRVTTFGDEVTLSAMSKLITFRHIQGEVFKEGMRLAQDMAVMYKMDLNSAVMQLGKALDDPAKGLERLTRVGVMFTNSQINGIKKLVAEGKAHEAQLEMLAELNNQFGGAAKAAAETAASAWSMLKNEVGDLMEKIGSGVEGTKGIAIMLRDYFSVLNVIAGSKELSGFERFIGMFPGNIHVLKAHNTGMREALDIMKQVDDKVRENLQSYTSLEQKQARLTELNQWYTKVIKEKGIAENDMLLMQRVWAAEREKLQIEVNQALAAETEAAERAAEAAKKRAEERLKEYQKAQEIIKGIIGERWSERLETHWDSPQLFKTEDADIAKQSWGELEDAMKQVDEVLLQLDADTIEHAKSYDFLGQQASMIFADISELSSSMIRQIIANAEQYVNTNKNLTDEQIAEYRRAIDQANTYLVEKNPWEAIRMAQERYIKAIKDYNNAQKDYDLAKQASDGEKMRDAIDAQNQALLEQAAALSIVRQAYQEIGGMVKQLVGFFGDLAEAAGLDSGVIQGFESLISGVIDLVVASDLLQKTFNKVADAADKVSDATEDVANATEDVAEGVASTGSAIGGVVGAFFAIASAILQIGTAIASMKKAQEDAAIQAYIDSINEKLEELQRRLENISKMKGIGDSWFTVDNFNKIKQLVDAINAAVIGAERFVSEMKQEFIGIPDMIKANEAFNDIQKGYSDLQKKIGQGLRIDMGEIDKLIELAYEFKGAGDLSKEQNAVFDDFIKAMEEAKKYYEELVSTVQGVVGDISGSLLNTVKSVWEEFGIAGEDSIARVTAAAKESIGEIVDEMVSQQIWATTMSKYFNDLGDGLVEAIGSGDSGALMAVFDEFWAGMQIGLADYNKAMMAFYETAETHGWNITPQAGGDNTAKDSIRAMREELAKLQEQWDSLSAAERESADGEKLYGDIGNLEKRIQAAEDLYNVNIDVADSINGINAELSRLEAEWNAMSKAEREGEAGMQNRADKSYYENLLDEAQGVQTSELEKMQALLDSAEAKYSLYQKWVQLYGKDTADQMMGDMLDDAESYVDELRSGIAELTAKVTEGTATDEEIAQLEAWEG